MQHFSAFLLLKRLLLTWLLPLAGGFSRIAGWVSSQLAGSSNSGWILLLAFGCWLPVSGQAQTILQPGDIVIAGLNSTDPDDFAFAPLVNLTAGTQIQFTDNGWIAASGTSSGSFRATEGIATYTAPAGGVARGTIISLAANRTNFSLTSQFLLSVDGDQLLAYQGTSSAPTFIYALTTRGSGWTNATSSNTSALPSGLQNGTTAVAVSWSNAYMSQAGPRQGSAATIRTGFSTASNWSGSNSTRVSWPTTSLQIQLGAVLAAATVAPMAGTDQTRVRELVFGENNFANYELLGDILLADNSGCAITSTKKAVVYLRLDTGPVHNVGTDPNAPSAIAASFNVTVRGCDAAGNCTLTLPSPLSSGVDLHIDGHAPQQVFALDLAPYLASTTAGPVKLRVEINTLSVAPAAMRRHVRLLARLEQSQVITAPAVTAVTTAPAGGLTYDKVEYAFEWTSGCNLVRNYQLQILKLLPGASATSTDWQERATLLETENSSTQLTTVLAEGPGTYVWRVRAIGSAEGGIANPGNWGAWSNESQLVLNEPTANTWTTDLNWIYSRTFSEGGRVAEQLTFANSLLYTRQMQTRLHLGTISGPLLIGLQTIQDYTGRNALQSLPIPLTGGSQLGYRTSLLNLPQNANAAYTTNMFDEDSKLLNPAAASVRDNYYSGTSSGIDNTGVPSAEGIPFTRTLYTRDGTDRVREQGNAGQILGLQSDPAKTHTVRISYGSVAQPELTRLFGANEAPLAKNTYKIITQDPNNITVVTYQTKEGQTIATALSADSGAPNLSLVTSPKDSIFTVKDHINDNVPYGNVGSISSKILIVPPGGSMAVNLSYSITPNTIQDACGRCSTCDYKAVIVVRNVDNPTPSAKEVKFEAPLIICGAPAPALDSIPRVILPPGTYAIEKTVVAYNSTAGQSTTYLDGLAAGLRSDLMSYKTTGLWPVISTFLANKDITGLYSRLGSEPSVTQVTHNGLAYYSVPFGPGTAGSPLASCPYTAIEIPILDTNCGDVVSVCNAATPGFEAYLQQEAPACYAQFATYFPNMIPGDIDKMVGAMMQDPLFTGKCDTIWNCWRSTVASYDALLQLSTTGGASPYAPNFLQDFLDCLNVKMRKAVSPSTPIPAAERYYTFVFDDNNPAHINCLAYYGNSTNNTTGIVLANLGDIQTKLNSGNPAQLAILNNIYNCTRFSSNNSNLPNTPAGTTVFVQQQLDAMQVSCEQRCEDRRLEFRQAILADFRRQGIYTYADTYALVYDAGLNTYVPGTAPLPTAANPVEECEILFMIEELVRECKGSCRLTGTATTNPNGFAVDPTQLALFQSAVLDKMEIQVKKVGDNCRPGYAPVGVLPGPTLRNIQPTRCAEDLVSYLNALIHRANTIPNLTNPSRQPLGCPTTGQQGIGEKEVGILSYVGPLDVSGNRVFSDASTFAGQRQHYWVTVQDARLDVNGNANPGQAGGRNYSNPAYALSSDFRVIWSTSAYSDYPIFPGVCYATGEDVPGVPKLLSPGSSATFDYIIRFIDGNGQPVPKQDITNVSPPLINGSNTDPYSEAGVYVTLTMKNGSTQQVRILLLPAAPFTNNAGMADQAYLKQFLMWKDVPQECKVTNRTYSTCYRWVKMAVDTTDQYAYNPVAPTCGGLLAATITSAITTQQEAWIQKQVDQLRTAYASQCASAGNLRDDLTIRYKLGLHHYTLYYYDRNGNLIKTVPPEGVEPIDFVGNPTATPAHRMATTYRYNSLKQLVAQATPDGGKTLFYYNRVGQLRFSQNEKQLDDHIYSYTKYDNLGRVTEVGESHRDAPDFNSVLAQIETAGYPLDMDPAPSTTHYNQQTTLTYYNTPNSSVTYKGQAQRYLTNRVSYVVSQADVSAQSVYTYYSYDPHGNVEWLAQKLPGLDAKFISYEYDLISNKVLRVSYQDGARDQFYHRYEYDDDNRLLAVYTSADGQIWDQDARYEYYAHGPLKRTVLGQDQVQGLDYTYTLQGWLKGINHPNLDSSQDPGKDGATSGAGVDAFGMTLGYFQGDYVRPGSFLDATPTGGTANANLFEPNASQNLYNGNIATWQSRNRQDTPSNTDPAVLSNPIAPQLNELYRYDQLNRLKSSTQYDRSANQRTALTDYATSYSYDANGNLQTLKRNMGTQLLDDLQYHYGPPNTKLEKNQLQSVTDVVPNNVSGEDIDNQIDADNYAYDKVGNLVKDKQSKIFSIAWTPYGKISRVAQEDPNYPGNQARAIIYIYDYDAAGNRVRKTRVLESETHITYYVRDAQGNIMALYDQSIPVGSPAQLRLAEQPIYGTTRLGERKPDLLLTGLSAATTTYTRKLGDKYYELNDHLGNVRAVVRDEKQATLANSIPDIASFKPSLSAYYNYYPFGMLQPGRYGPGNSTAAGGYRFGYNGKEKDNSGELGLTNYDYGFRIYNPGLGKFLSLDPLTRKYPELTPYQFASNTPIQAVDLDGQESFVVTEQMITGSLWQSWSETSGHPLPANINTDQEVAKKYGWELAQEYIDAGIMVLGLAVGPEDLAIPAAAKLVEALPWLRTARTAQKIIHAEQVAAKIERTVVAEVRLETKVEETVAKATKVSPNGGCFTAATLVYTSQGGKPIEQIKVGASLWSYNEKKQQTEAISIAQSVHYKKFFTYISKANRAYISSALSYPFYIKEWLKTKVISASNYLFSQNIVLYHIDRIDSFSQKVQKHCSVLANLFNSYIYHHINSLTFLNNEQKYFQHLAYINFRNHYFTENNKYMTITSTLHKSHKAKWIKACHIQKTHATHHLLEPKSKTIL